MGDSHVFGGKDADKKQVGKEYHDNFCNPGKQRILDKVLDSFLDHNKKLCEKDGREWIMALITGVQKYNQSKLCGKVWAQSYVGYRCRTCSISPNMSLCSHCFKAGDHRGHDYNMFRSPGGGTCDCGNGMVMQSSGFCPRHGDNAVEMEAPKELTRVIRFILPKLIWRLIMYFRDPSIDDDEVVGISDAVSLTGSDNNAVDRVYAGDSWDITSSSNMNPTSSEESNETSGTTSRNVSVSTAQTDYLLANMINQHNAPRLNQERVKELDSFLELFSLLIDTGQAVKHIIVDVLLDEGYYASQNQKYQTAFSSTPSRGSDIFLGPTKFQLVQEYFKSSFETALPNLSYQPKVGCDNVLGELMRWCVWYDFPLKLLMVMLNLLSDLRYRNQFTMVFLDIYPVICQRLQIPKRATSVLLHALHVSVQLFSNQDICVDMIRERDALNLLLTCLELMIKKYSVQCKLMEVLIPPFRSNKHACKFSYHRCIDVENELMKDNFYFSVVSDLINMFTHKPVALIFLRNETFLSTWVSIIATNQGMNVNIRQLNDHIEFEPESYYTSFAAELEICECTLWALFAHLTQKEDAVSCVPGILERLFLQTLSWINHCGFSTPNFNEIETIKEDNTPTDKPPTKPPTSKPSLSASVPFKPATKIQEEKEFLSPNPFAFSFHIPLHRNLAIFLTLAIKHQIPVVPILRKFMSSAATHQRGNSFLMGESSEPQIMTARSSLQTAQKYSTSGGKCHPCSVSGREISTGFINHPTADVWKLLLIHPLSIQVATAEIACNMWARNGLQIKSQALTYNQTHFSSSMIDLDYYLAQVCACFLPADYFVNTMLDRFHIRESLSLSPRSEVAGSVTDKSVPSQGNTFIRDEYQEHSMIDAALQYILTIICFRSHTGLSEAEGHRLELITLLSISDKSHSQLVDNLPERFSIPGGTSTPELHQFRYTGLMECLAEVATFRTPSCNSSGTLHQGLYRLRETAWVAEFDPLFTMLRCQQKKNFQEAMNRYNDVVRRSASKIPKMKVHLGSTEDSSSTSLHAPWPPFRLPERPGNAVYLRLYGLLASRTLHAVIFTMLRRCLVDSRIIDTSIYLTVFLTELAIMYSCPSHASGCPSPSNNEDADVADMDLISFFDSDCIFVNACTLIKTAHRSDEVLMRIDNERIAEENQVLTTGNIHEDRWKLCMERRMRRLRNAANNDKQLTTSASGFALSGSTSNLSEADNEDIFQIDESIISLLFKLYDKCAVESNNSVPDIPFFSESPTTSGQTSPRHCYDDSDPLSRVGDAQHFIGLVLNRLASGDPRCARVIKDRIEQLRHSSQAKACREKAAKEKAIIDRGIARKNKMLAEMQARQQAFLTNIPASVDPSSPVVSADRKITARKQGVSRETYSCCICSQGGRSTVERPFGIVALGQQTRVLAHRYPTATDRLIIPDLSTTTTTIPKGRPSNEDPNPTDAIARRRSSGPVGPSVTDLAFAHQTERNSAINTYVIGHGRPSLHALETTPAIHEPLGFKIGRFFPSEDLVSYFDKDPLEAVMASEGASLRDTYHTSFATRPRLPEISCGSLLDARAQLILKHFNAVSALQATNLCWAQAVSVTSCGHAVHIDCHADYYKTLQENADNLRNSQSMAVENSEFACPFCRSLSNTVFPVIPDERLEVWSTQFDDPSNDETGRLQEIMTLFFEPKIKELIKTFSEHMRPSERSDLFEALKKLGLDLAMHLPESLFPTFASHLYEGMAASLLVVVRGNLELDIQTYGVSFLSASNARKGAREFLSAMGHDIFVWSQVSRETLALTLSRLCGLSTDSVPVPESPRKNPDGSSPGPNVPLLLHDPISLLLQFVFAAFPPGMPQTYYRVLARACFNLVFVQACIKVLASSDVSPSERSMWISDDTIPADPSRTDGLIIHLARLCTAFNIDLTDLQKASECARTGAPIVSGQAAKVIPCEDDYCVSISSPSALESAVQKKCLPFLRIAALLQHYLYQDSDQNATPFGTLAPSHFDTALSEYRSLTHSIGLWGNASNLRNDGRRVPDDDMETVIADMDWSLSDMNEELRALILAPTEDSSGHLVQFPLTSGTDSTNVVKMWFQNLALLRGHNSTVMHILTTPVNFGRSSLLRPPSNFDALFYAYLRKTCSKCGKTPAHPAVCMVCGTFVCFKTSCCKETSALATRSSSGMFEGVGHSRSCGGNSAVLFIINSCVVIVIQGAKACLWGPLYLDSHGEEDRDLKRGRPLHLSDAYFSLLEHQWRSNSFKNSGRRWLWHDFRL